MSWKRAPGVRFDGAMLSRKLQAVLACAVLFAAAQIYGVLAGVAVDQWRVLCWGGIGVCTYILLSRLFGFDPHRTPAPQFTYMWPPTLMAYIDRWELRSGQATLGMFGCVAAAALLIDAGHFLLAVVCATLAAWIYFVLRLITGGYE